MSLSKKGLETASLEILKGDFFRLQGREDEKRKKKRRKRGNDL